MTTPDIPLPEPGDTSWSDWGQEQEDASDAVNNGRLTAATLNAAFAAPADTIRVVVHGSTAGTARPTGWASVLWIGTVQPTNAVANRDLFLDITGA